MNLFTSSFAIAGREKSAVAISVGKPRSWTGRSFDKLAPEWVWVRNHHRGIWTDADYAEAYNGLLEKLDAADVVKELGNNSIMLCFCSVPKVKCHRLLVSRWLSRETNLIIPEWKPRPIAQFSLPFSQ